MNRYQINYKNKSIVRRAESAPEAINKLCNQYGWNSKLEQIDADTCGTRWAAFLCDPDGGINYEFRIIATIRDNVAGLEKRYSAAIKAIGGTPGLLALPDNIKNLLKDVTNLETKVRMLEEIAKSI